MTSLFTNGIRHSASVLVVLLVSISAASASADIIFTKGKRLQDLPGAKLIAPTKTVAKVGLSLVPSRVVGKVGANTILNFTAMVYQNSFDKKAYLFGPTVRLAAGQKIRFDLTNDLAYPPGVTELAPGVNSNTFSEPLRTNLHTHGLHVQPGVQSQKTAQNIYGGSDNIFFQLKAKAGSKGSSLQYSATLPKDHLPGMHWYHPHSHGSSGIQSATANGLIIVEDNPKWLPDRNGCKSLRNELTKAKEVILSFGFMLFRAPQPSFPGATANLDDASIPSWNNDAENPLCCGNDTSANAIPGALTGSQAATNFVLVNGGLAPVIEMQAGVFQRWRMAHVGFKYFLDMQILDSKGNPAKECETMLVAKDGVYMLQIPRKVDNIFLAAANRAEVLVRCTPASGKAATYTLSSGVAPSPFGNYTSFSLQTQDVLATLSVSAKKGSVSRALVSEACTPLRPSYAQDLQDPSLQKAKATGALEEVDVKFTYELPYGCLVNSQNFTFPDPKPISHLLGKVVEWPAFENANEHPLHIHTNPFQVIRLSGPDFLQPGAGYGQWFSPGDFYDTLMLPMTMPFAAGNATIWPNIGIRLQPSYTGYSVMHCHSLQHEDTGCMKVIKWSCPGSENKDAQPTACSFKYPVPGTFK